MQYQLHHGDCLAVLAEMPDSSVDSIVTDPPYELGFMGKSWDASGIAYNVDMWREALRVLKPGGHLLAFSGSRTYHRMTCAIEDAGFEIRDQIMWVYGSGFPKSLDVSKAIDKARDDSAEGKAVGAWLKAQREARGFKQKDVAALWPSVTGGLTGCVANWETLGKVPKWDQWQTLKSFIGFGDEMDAEVWRLNGRKGQPGDAWSERAVVGVQKNAMAGWNMDGTTKFADRDITVPATDAARQWDGWGTALKPAHEPICVARKPLVGTVAANVLVHGTGALNIDGCRVEGPGGVKWEKPRGGIWKTDSEATAKLVQNEQGRWPANLIHDGSDEVVTLFPDAKGQQGAAARKQGNVYGAVNAGQISVEPRNDTGSAARFFYCAKASKSDRGADNNHPTVKPNDLMAYLCRLVTPRGGVVLDPFMGSGSTGKAAMHEGLRFVGIDMTADYVEIARARIEHALFGDLL